MKQVRPYHRAHERGVTLIELVVVLALIGTMALITVPNFISIYQSSRVKATARSMITDVRNARQLAISGNTRTRLAFNTGTNVHQYEIYRESKDRLTGTSVWTRTRYGNLGSVVYIASSNFENRITGDGGMKDVVFMPNGTLWEESIPDADPPWHVTIKTEQEISKPSYRLEFTATGNVVLR